MSKYILHVCIERSVLYGLLLSEQMSQLCPPSSSWCHKPILTHQLLQADADRLCYLCSQSCAAFQKITAGYGVLPQTQNCIAMCDTRLSQAMERRFQDGVIVSAVPGELTSHVSCCLFTRPSGLQPQECMVIFLQAPSFTLNAAIA